MASDTIVYFIPKLINRIAIEKNRLWKYFNAGKVAMAGYRGFPNASSSKAQLDAILGTYDKTLLSSVVEDEKEVIQFLADQAMRHEFDLLGSGPTKLEPIDWHVDFKCGKHWAKQYYRDISGIKGADIKVPWELSRCQHLLWLGEAYLLTNEKKYAQEIIDEINWWIGDNPFMYSVNWTCSMDVAFRAVNWMFALNMICGYDGFDDAFSEKVSRSLWQHGFYIRNNLERVIPYSNNHYTSDIVGLLYIGAFFKKTRKGAKWYSFSLREYYSETRLQVLPSGVHYERSISYHRMMTEMLSYPVYLLKRLGEEIPSDVKLLIEKMYAYVGTYTKPNGLSPLIADNDDGRFAPFIKRDFRRHGYLNDPQSIENKIVAVGMKPMFCETPKEEGYYEDAGVAVYKKATDYLFINQGGYSKVVKDSETIIPTHTHNDLLSFELCLNGMDIIVDAGTYLYTSSVKDRNAFRETAKHNTIIVEGEEQNECIAPFSLKRNVRIGKLKKIKDGVFEGEYTTIREEMHHKRTFENRNGKYIITDNIVRQGLGLEANWYFHFAKGIEPAVNEDGILSGKGWKITFSDRPYNIRVVDDYISPSYGVLEESKTAVVGYKFNNNIIIRIEIDGQE